MSNSTAIYENRNDYILHVQRFWDVLKEDGADKANLETFAANKIVKYWADEGLVLEFLLPLLSHKMESVRYAAAAELLNYGAPIEAVKVLKDISKNPEGFIAPTARLLLMKKRIS